VLDDVSLRMGSCPQTKAFVREVAGHKHSEYAGPQWNCNAFHHECRPNDHAQQMPEGNQQEDHSGSQGECLLAHGHLQTQCTPVPGDRQRLTLPELSEGPLRIGAPSCSWTPSRSVLPTPVVPILGTVYTDNVRVVARSTIKRFVDSLAGQKDQRAVKAALDTWFQEVQAAAWRNPAEVKASYATASILGGERIVFNIKGNDYRLVTAVDYRRRTVFIKWIGSHAAYDRIDARTVQYGT